MSIKKRHIPFILAGLAALLTIAVYLPALRNGFVNWDDDVNVTDNPAIRLLGLPFLKWAFTDVTVSYWQPVVWISHAVDYALWGLDPAGHHLTNILLHGLNTFLVVLLVFRLFEAAKASRLRLGGPPLPDERFGLVAAGVTGLLFGIHPLHVESVAWVTERKDLLSTLFFLVTLLAWLRYAGGRGWTRTGGFVRDRRYLFALSLFVLALASKPMVVTLPVVLLLLDWYPLERIAGRKDLVPSLVEKIPFLALGFILSAVTIAAHRAQGVVKSLNEVSLLARLESAARAAVVYLDKMALPLHLSPYYPDPKTVPVLSFGYLGSLALVAAITAACLYLAKRRRYLIPAAWGYYVVTLLPVLGLIKTNAVTVADRFTYLPGIGPFLLLGLASAVVWERTERKGRAIRRTAAAVAVVLCLALTVLTVRQIGIWKNGIVFWTAVIEKEGDQAPVAYNNRAMAFKARGDLDRAFVDYAVAIRLKPDMPEAFSNRGIAFRDLGQYDRALDDFNSAIRVDPQFADAYTGRGWTYAAMGREKDALEDYDRAISLDPSRAIPYNDRGMLRQSAGQTEAAIGDFTTAVTLDPSFAQAYVNRGAAYGQTGRFDLALADYTAAIRENPSFANAYNNRGLVYEQTGRPAEALADLTRAIELDPSSIEAYNNRGLALEDLGRFEDAVASYTRAIELQPGDAPSYTNRGIALEKLGRRELAKRDYEAACRLGDEAGCAAARRDRRTAGGR